MPQLIDRAEHGMFWKLGAGVLAIIALSLAILLFRANADADRREGDIHNLAERMQALESDPLATNPASFEPWVSRGDMVASPRAEPLSGEATGTTGEQAEALNKRLLTSLESRFSRQPVDGNAPRVEIELLRAMNDKQLAGANINLKDPDVSCKQNVCRISAVFRSNADATDWAALYLTTVGAKYFGNAQTAYTRNPDGSVRVQLYANRTGATP